jgi:hypothetical protein
MKILISFIAVIITIGLYFYLIDLADKKYKQEKQFYQDCEQSAHRVGNYSNELSLYDEELKLTPGLHNLFNKH